MGQLHALLAWLSLVFLCCLCAGMVLRRKLGQSVVFTVYVFASTSFTALILIAPEYFNPEFFTVKQGIYDSLLFGMSLDLAHRTFAAFRGIAGRTRALLAAAVLGSAAAVLISTPPNPEFSDIAKYQPGITTAGIWCLTLVGLLIVWYQIPVPAFTRAIVLGAVPYWVVFVVCIDLIGRAGWGAIRHINVLNAFAFNLVVGYWTRAAWRND